MNVPRPQIEPQFANAKDVEEYDRWFRAQVKKALDDPRSGIPHDLVMARMRAIIADKSRKSRSRKQS